MLEHDLADVASSAPKSLLKTEPKVGRESSRWRRSLHESHKFDADGNCLGWRAHLNFAVEEIYGRLLDLAGRDYVGQMFAWAGHKDLMAKSRFNGAGYSRSLVFSVIKLLVKHRLIEPARKVRWGKLRKGWIVHPHDYWTVNFENELGLCALKSSEAGYRDYLAQVAARKARRQAKKSGSQVVAVDS
jgi:hypothetical protein